MITKQQIDTLLSIVKPETPQDKQLLACIQYELYKCVDDYELSEKHFKNEIKKYKYVRALPKIQELEKNIKSLEKGYTDLLKEFKDKEAECKAYKRRVIKLQRFLRNDLYKQEMLKQIEKATNRIYQYNYKLDDVEEELKKLRESIEGDD